MTQTTRTILITGATSGIGRATALAFAARGWNVAAVGRNAEALTELATVTAQYPGVVLTLSADVTDSVAMQTAAAETVARFGALHAVIANAGVGQQGTVVEADWAHLDTMLRTNIDGVYHTIRATVPHMRQAGGGQIVIISSVLATLISPYYASYTASKAFVASFAKSLRMELANDHISVTDIRVGRTATAFNARRLGGSTAEKKRSLGIVPVMTPEFVAAGIVRAVERCPKVVYLRLFDRLLAWGGFLTPGLIGRFTGAQYKPH